MFENSINPVVNKIPQALSVYINQVVYDLKREGRDVTTLSLGEAFFDIPEFDYNDIDLQRGYHYSDSLGIPSLRAKISSFYKKQYNVNIDSGTELLITAGSKPAIFMCMLAVLAKGEEVLIHEPAWLSYQEQARLAGGEAKFIPYNECVINFDKYIGTKTKMLIINNPNNPQGKLYSREELSSLYELCKSRGVYLLVDEAYSDFVLNGEFVSAGDAIKEKDFLFVVNSLSKNFGMSGWRIGYVISSSFMIQQLLKLNQHLITCAPTLLMLYLDKHFDEILSYTLPQALEVTKKRLKVVEMLDHLNMEYLPGGSTFYIFIDVSKFSGSTFNLSMYLLAKHGIAVVPGEAYGDSTQDFIRVSVGAETLDTIKEALDVINETVNNISITTDEVNKLMSDSNLTVLK